MRHKHGLTWNMARNTQKRENEKCMFLKNVENEKCTLQDMEYGKKIQNKKNEKYTLQDLEYGEETENVETETQTLQDL